MKVRYTGGCQCGRIRYQVSSEGLLPYFCHCRMCQRATSGFDDPNVFVPQEHFGAESLMEAWISTGDLPRKHTNEYQPIVDKWKAVGQGVSV